MITVVACPHPLRPERHVWQADGRPTVEDLIVEAAKRGKVPLAALGNAVVVIRDRIVPKERWKHTRPKSGPVAIKALPADPISLSIAAIGSYAAAGVGALVPTAFALAHPLATAAIIGIAQAGIGIVTSLAVGALSKAPKQRSLGSDGPTNPTFSIQGVRNEARPYGAIPKIYGRRVRYYPVQAAQPYTEIFYDNNQFLRAVFDVGYGPLSISDIRIGDTPIAQYPGISYEVRQGYPGDAPLTLFPSQVREESLSIQLKYASGFSIRTTQPDTDEVTLDVLFPQGLIRISDRNIKFGLEVQFEVQYRLTGTSTWTAAPLTSNHFGVYFLGAGKFKVAAKEKAAVRRSVRFVLPTRGQYDIQIRRLTIDDQADNTGDNQSITQEDSYWGAIRSFRNDAPIRKTGIARIAIRAQATDSLNGVIDQLNCTVQAILPVWNGSTWVEQQTRSPAWAFCDVLRGSANARALAASRIDLARMLEWDAQTTADGVTFDAAIDQQRSVAEWLDDIAGTANAKRITRNGLYSVALDNVKSTVVQHFSPRNSRAFQSSKIFATRPHGIKVRFPNELTYHQIDEITVYDDGYTAANATLFETIELPYTTSASQAWKRGRRAMFAARLRPEIYSLETDIEGIVCEEGDLVRVTHDVPMWGVSFARVAALATSGSDTTGVTIDAPVPMSTGSYALRVRLATGDTLVVPVDTVAGEQTSLTFTTPVLTATGPAVGDLALFGESGTESVELVVRSIESTGDMGMRITFQDYAPDIQTADTGAVPEFDPQITLPPVVNRPTPPSPVITSIDSDEDVLIRASDGTLTSRILVAVQVDQLATDTPAELIQARYRPADTSQDWTFLASFPAPSGTVSVLPVDDGDTYEIEFRSVAQAGGTSEWIRTTHTVVGKTTPPPSVERFYRQGSALTWPYPSPPVDLAGFLLRANYGTSTDWGAARALHPGVVTAPPFDISALSGTQTILIKAVDTSGIESAVAATVTIDLGDLPVSNVVETQSEAPDWTGTLTGGTDTGTDIEADLVSSPPFYGPAGAQLYGASGDAFYEANYYDTLTYVARWTPDTSYLHDGLLKLELTVTGDYTIDYRISTSPAFYGASGDPLYGTAGDPFYDVSEVGEWTPWPGVLGPFDTVANTYDIRLTTVAGATQSVCSQFDLITDLPDVVEVLDDITIAAASTRLPITKTYRAIKVVNVTVQTDGNGGISARIIDKDESLGPDIEVLNAAGTAVDGLVDAYIQGY